MILELSRGISFVLSSFWTKKQHVSLDPSRSIPVDQPHVSTFPVLRGTVLGQAGIPPDLGFGLHNLAVGVLVVSRLSPVAWPLTAFVQEAA